MSSSPVPPSTVRFVEFTADLETRELFRNGSKIRLQGQPFEVLAVLLEHPGRLVTRDELRQRLWPADSFVDFDHGLNAAVKRLRDALGDDADNPKFIETVPRRGYKFICSIDGLPQGAALAGNVETKHRLRRIAWIASFLLVLVAITGISWRAFSKHLPTITASARLSFAGRALAPALSYGEWFPALVTDGSRIYYSALKDGKDAHSKLAYVSTAGGEQVFMTTPLKYAEVRNISPDGSTLLVYGSMAGLYIASEGTNLWLVSTAGGGLRRLGDVHGHDGAWSPDGRQLVYADDQSLNLASSDGSESRKLVGVPGKAFWIRWSPDSTLIRFTIIDQKTNTHRLWECRANGTGLRRLALGEGDQAQECCGEWTPDGKFFLFRMVRDNHADIWSIQEKFSVLSRRTRKPVRLTAGLLDSTAAIPSRDGKKLFVVETSAKPELLAYDLNTRKTAQLLSGISARNADVSADQEWIAYVEHRGQESILWRARADGRERLQLAGLPLMYLDDPRWSPDATQVSFVAKMPDKPWSVYVIRAGGGTARVISPEGENILDQTWSPDGQSLMFGHPPDYWLESGTSKAIYILNLKTDHQSTLPGSEGLFSPRWSLDGRYAAAMPLSQKKIMLFDFATQRWTELAEQHCVDNPTWSRDGDHIYFNNCNNIVMRVSRVTRKLEEVLDTDTINPNGWGCRVENANWDSMLLLRCRVNDSDIYALTLELP